MTIMRTFFRVVTLLLINVVVVRSYCSRLCCEANTPMRKLIVSMPDMALKVLDKCVTTVGDEGRKLHEKHFNYEFLEDHFAIRRWCTGKKIKLNTSFISKFSLIFIKT